MLTNIHTPIIEKLDYFYSVHKIPNIIFHGPSGSGKHTIVNNFINKIYNDNKDIIKSFVMYVNCAHGKGIKFIRDELKFFAKTHINSNGGDVFKSIVLLNADKLTMDAQSALRRCIELFSHTTRFFIVVEDKYKLLKPILSRFCEIYIPEIQIKNTTINLYKYNLENVFNMKDVHNKRIDWLKKEIGKINKNASINDLFEITTKLYEKGYSALDILDLLENNVISNILKDLNIDLTNEKKYELLLSFNKVKKEFRSEKLLMLFIFNFIFLSLDYNLENISFM